MTNDQILTELRSTRKEVKGLREDLQKSQAVVKRLKLLSWCVAALFVFGGGFAWEQIDQNGDNAKQQCENTNQRSSLILQGWHFILGYELIDKTAAQAPAETAMSEAILPWFDKVYAPRDCENLDKEYKIPPVPELPKSVD